MSSRGAFRVACIRNDGAGCLGTFVRRRKWLEHLSIGESRVHFRKVLRSWASFTVIRSSHLPVRGMAARAFQVTS